MKELHAKITIADLDNISGMSWALTGVVFEKVIVPSADSKIVLQKTQEPLTFALRQCFSLKPFFSDLVMLKLGLSVEHVFVVSIPQHSCNPQSVVNDWQCLKTWFSKESWTLLRRDRPSILPMKLHVPSSTVL